MPTRTSTVMQWLRLSRAVIIARCALPALRALRGVIMLPILETLNMKRYIKLHQLIEQNRRCKQSNNEVWEGRTLASILAIMDSAPSGSGFDSGTKLIWPDDKAYKADVLQFTTAFHHMNETGMYDGWTEHVVTVKPHLSFGFVLAISGRDRNGIKEYINEVFEYWLNEDIAEHDE